MIGLILGGTNLSFTEITIFDMKRPIDESSQYFLQKLFLYFLKVVDLEMTITIFELMDLHRLERILLGRRGEVQRYDNQINDVLERTENGRISGQLAFRPSPTQEMYQEGLMILKRKRNDLRVVLFQCDEIMIIPFSYEFKKLNVLKIKSMNKRIQFLIPF